MDRLTDGACNDVDNDLIPLGGDFLFTGVKKTHIELELPAALHGIGNPGAALTGADPCRVAMHVNNAGRRRSDRSAHWSSKENGTQQQQGGNYP